MGSPDVCVQYTFVDAHQSAFFTRVVEDRVIGSSHPAHGASLDAMEYPQTGVRRPAAEILAPSPHSPHTSPCLTSRPSRSAPTRSRSRLLSLRYPEPVTPLALASIFVTLAALFSLVSVRLLRLPASVGAMALASVSALVLAALGPRAPSLHDFAVRLFQQINFHDLVLHNLLAFLLFAAALSLDLDQLNRQKVPILLLSTVGTVLAAALIGTLLWTLLTLARLHLDLPLCLLFGALISPTDPIAVLDMLRRVGAPPFLHTLLGSESLFNDGVGAVLFFTLLDLFYPAVATSHPTLAQSALHAFTFSFLFDACGGLLLGGALGFLGYLLIRIIDRPTVEILLTLALAMSSYALADSLSLSAPLAVIAAGIVCNSHGRGAMSDKTLEELDSFWSLLDEMLNTILFLLLGFALIVVPLTIPLVLSGLLAIVAVLLGRGLSVLLLALAPSRDRTVPFRSQWLVLTWGGLRGALPLALVLALVGRPGSSALLSITYLVVSFSVIAQGLTMIPLLRHLHLNVTAPLPELEP